MSEWIGHNPDVNANCSNGQPIEWLKLRKKTMFDRLARLDDDAEEEGVQDATDDEDGKNNGDDDDDEAEANAYVYQALSGRAQLTFSHSSSLPVTKTETRRIKPQNNAPRG
ncbi:hypothetical protein LTR36_004805 [Oleoguttula mirabilis]|uniref:Uncharacterized protein n=1 Tax=Oleoguttula mirabilis TaxID=1507867 RepID=A0AAV9JFD7_9PEZI|nr:hypothetical protein LTR36_004805 [Oleoguttula mirabilis]